MTADPRKLFSRVHGEKSADEVMHSSGFAQVQNQHYGSDGCGSVPGSYEARGRSEGRTGAFADQRSADARRRYVKGYENARLVRSAYTAERARAYVPRTRSEFGSGVSRAGRDTSGDGISGSLIGRKISN